MYECERTLYERVIENQLTDAFVEYNTVYTRSIVHGANVANELCNRASQLKLKYKFRS